MKDFFHQIYEWLCLGLSFIPAIVFGVFIKDNLPSLKISDLRSNFKRIAHKAVLLFLMGFLYIRALTTKDPKVQLQIAVLLFAIVFVPVIIKALALRQEQQQDKQLV